MKISKLLVNTLLNEIKTYKKKNPLAIEPFLSSSQYWVYPNYGHRLVIVDPSDENFVIKYQMDAKSRDNELEYKICHELFQRRLAARFDIAYAYQLSEDYRYLKMERALGLQDRSFIAYPDWLVDKKPHNLGLIDARVVVVDYGNIAICDYLDLTFRLD